MSLHNLEPLYLTGVKRLLKDFPRSLARKWCQAFRIDLHRTTYYTQILVRLVSTTGQTNIYGHVHDQVRKMLHFDLRLLKRP